MRYSTLFICLGSLLLSSCMMDPNAYNPSQIMGTATIKGTNNSKGLFDMQAGSTDVTAIDQKTIETNYPLKISSGKHLISTSARFMDGWMGNGYKAQDNILLDVKSYENYTVEASHTKHHVQTWIIDSEGNVVTKKTNSIAMPMNGEAVYLPPLPKN